MTRDDGHLVRARGGRRRSGGHRARGTTGRRCRDLVAAVRGGKLVAAVGAGCVLAAGAALGSAALIAAATGSAPARAGATRGITTQVVLANGDYRYCLDDYRQGRASGTEVVLWRCDAHDRGQQWVFFSDATIRPAVAPGEALGIAADGRTVLRAAGAAGTRWTYHANGAMRDDPPSAAPRVDEPGLNDPGGRVGDGVQLLAYRQVHTTANADWWVSGADYATTEVTDLPDAGLHGGSWARDTGTYLEVLVYVGRSRRGGYTYEYARHVLANFRTVPAAPQPNGTTTDAVIGETLTGWMWGWTTTTVTATMPASSTPSPDVDGTFARRRELRPRGFFPAAARVTRGATSGYFRYTSNADGCGDVETMVLTESGGAPGDPAERNAVGNIAASGAVAAGGPHCRGQSGGADRG